MRTGKQMLVAALLAAALLVSPVGLSVTTGGPGPGLSLASTASTAYALRIDNTSGRKTRKQLEDAGYTCTYVATGFYECTKAGDTAYWCDGTGACDEKPFRTVPTNRGRTVITPGGGITASQP